MTFTPAEKELKVRAAQTLIDAGWRMADAVAAVGYSKGSLGHLKLTSGPKLVGRNLRMAEMYREGKTLEEIGFAFELTRERVRQILSKSGLSRTNGGACYRKGRKDILMRADSRARRQARAASLLGVDYETAVALNGGHHFYAHGTRSSVYLHQKRSARTRNIEWAINFAEWCAVWDESGKWGLRGRGKFNYCMSRKADTGPYSVENVRIITNEQNIAEGWDVTPGSKRWGTTSAVREKQRRVYELRMAGHGHAEIAAELGITHKTSVQYCVVGKRLVAQEAAA